MTALVIDHLARWRFPPLSSAVVESNLLRLSNGCRQRLKKHFDRRFCRALVFWSPWRSVHPRHDRRCHLLFRMQCRADRRSLSSNEMRAESEARLCCGSLDQRLLAKSSLLSISRLPALVRFAERATVRSARRSVTASVASSTALTWRSARAFAWRRPNEVGAPDGYRALAQCRRRAQCTWASGSNSRMAMRPMSKDGSRIPERAKPHSTLESPQREFQPSKLGNRLYEDEGLSQARQFVPLSSFKGIAT